MDSFWDFFLYLVYIFLFVAYLIVLFQIITDLFRDRELSGGWKAVWVVFLIVLPFLTALVYLIVRGRGMAERQYDAVRQARTATDEYIQSVARQTSPADQIRSAKELLDSGAITPGEFERLKTMAMS